MLKFSRFLSLLLFFVMIINLVPVYAEEEVQPDSSNEAAVEAAVGSDTLAEIKQNIIDKSIEYPENRSVDLPDEELFVIENNIEIKPEDIVSTEDMSAGAGESGMMAMSDSDNRINVPTNVEAKKTAPTGLPYFSRNVQNAGISLRTGDSNYTYGILSLPGRNGLDLDLSIDYNLGSAVRGSGRAECYPNDVTKLNYRNIACGWEFNLPYISRAYRSVDNNYGNTTFNYAPSIKMMDGAYYDIKGDPVNAAQDTELSLSYYYGERVKIIHQAEPNQYVVTYSNDGHKEYYDGIYGNITKIADKYGNSITFNYSTLAYNAKANVEMTKETSELVVLSSITDSVGRTITFTYNTEDYESLCGTYSRVKDITVRVNENLNNYSSDKTYAVLSLSRFDTDHGSELSEGKRYKYADKLDDITDPDGKETSFFTMVEKTYPFDNTENYRSAEKECDVRFILGTVTHPTGGWTAFSYKMYKRYMHYLYSSQVYVPGPNQGEYYSDVKSTWYEVPKAVGIRDSSGVYDSYDFEDDYFGCILGDYNTSTTDHTKDQYKASVSYKSIYSERTKYEYNKSGELLKETTYPIGADTLDSYCKFITEYEYHPTYHKVAKKTYTVADCVRNGEAVTETADERWSETYTYDLYNPLVSSYVDKLGNKTEYTYYYDFEGPPSIMLKTEKQYEKNGSGFSAVKSVDYTLSGDKLNYAQITTDYGTEVYKTKYTYDTEYPGNVVRQEEYHGENAAEPSVVKTYSYDDADGKTGTYGRNAYVTKEAVIGVSTNTASFEETASDYVTYCKYGDAGRVSCVTDAEGNTTYYEYNGCGDVTRVITPDSELVCTEYIYSSTGENHVNQTIKGTLSEYKSYDGMGRLYFSASGQAYDEFRRLSGEVRYYYNNNGQLEYTVDGLGNGVYYTYDWLGRTAAELYFGSLTDPSDGTISESTAYAYTLYTYDDCVDSADRPSDFEEIKKASRVTINKGGRISDVYYDKYGREVMTETDSQAGVKKTHTVYNSKGNVFWTGDNYENYVMYEYDNRNLTTSATVCCEQGSVPEAKTTYEYDYFGNPTKVTSPMGKVTAYEYDSVGRLLKETTPMGYTEEYAYDKVGNVIAKKDKNGVVTNNTYNNMYYLTNSNTGGLATSYTYDRIGRVLTETNESGTTEYEYIVNNLSSITYPDGKSISYSYNIMDKISSVSVDGNSVSYIYTPLYDIKNITQSRRAIVSYTYDASGCMTNTAYRSGTVDYTYDNAMQVTSVTNKYNNNTISEYSYTYDTTGNISTKTDGAVLTEYSYGLGGRLLSSTDRTAAGTDENGEALYDELITDYTYDNDGNLTKKKMTCPASYEYNITVSGEEKILNSISTHEKNYTYDEDNRLIKEDELLIGIWKDDWMPRMYMNTINFTCDNNGNTLTAAFKAGMNPMDGVSKEYTYNKRNQLTGYSENGSDVAEYTYYADGLRRSKTAGADTTMFYYDRGNIVAEGDGTNITAQNLFGAEGIIKRTAGTNADYYYRDAHGDVKQTVNETTGAVTQSYAYDAYGNEANPSNTDSNPFRYCGEYYDEESGLIYLRNRYYDPSSQRFITEDPIKAGGNWYAYCSGNPVMYCDPSGLDVYLDGCSIYNYGEDERFKALQKLTDDILFVNNGYVYGVPNKMGINEKPIGTSLVCDIISNSETVSIGYNYDHQSGGYSVVYDTGDISVMLNPFGGRDLVTYDSSKKEYSETKSPLYITLGHELIHIIHHFEGTRYINIDSENTLYYYSDGQTFNEVAEISFEELETVGITYYITSQNGKVVGSSIPKGKYTENILRVENFLPIRVAYDPDRGGK